MTLTKYWARQIGLDGLQDGIEYSVLVVKSGPHQLGIQRGGYSGVGGLYVDRINVASSVGNTPSARFRPYDVGR